jgi:hypothetical protein
VKYADLPNGGGIAPGFWGCFENAVNVCSQTGIKLPEVFAALIDCGFTIGEMKELERCGSSKQSVIDYFKSWLSELKKVTPEPIKEVKEIIRYVSVPQSITEQSKELILS